MVVHVTTTGSPESVTLARRHVEQADRLVVEQKEILSKLRQEGLDTVLAESVLALFEETQTLMRTHLAMELKAARQG